MDDGEMLPETIKGAGIGQTIIYSEPVQEPERMRTVLLPGLYWYQDSEGAPWDLVVVTRTPYVRYVTGHGRDVLRERMGGIVSGPISVLPSL